MKDEIDGLLEYVHNKKNGWREIKSPFNGKDIFIKDEGKRDGIDIWKWEINVKDCTITCCGDNLTRIIQSLKFIDTFIAILEF